MGTRVENLHSDFPRAPLSFIKIDALKAGPGPGTLSFSLSLFSAEPNVGHKPVIVTSGLGVPLKGRGRGARGATHVREVD